MLVVSRTVFGENAFSIGRNDRMEIRTKIRFCVLCDDGNIAAGAVYFDLPCLLVMNRPQAHTPGEVFLSVAGLFRITCYNENCGNED